MILYGIAKSATDVVVVVAVVDCSCSGFGLLCDWQKINRSLQLLLERGLIEFPDFPSSAFRLFSTTHSLPLNRSQFWTMPFDSVIFSLDFSISIDDEDELLSLKTTRLEFSIDISEVFVLFWTCSYWFITDFSTTILWESSTTLCMFSDSVIYGNGRKFLWCFYMHSDFQACWPLILYVVKELWDFLLYQFLFQCLCSNGPSSQYLIVRASRAASVCFHLHIRHPIASILPSHYLWTMKQTKFAFSLNFNEKDKIIMNLFLTESLQLRAVFSFPRYL